MSPSEVPWPVWILVGSSITAIGVLIAPVRREVLRKQYRMWIDGSGVPAYVECLDREPTRELVDQVAATITEALDDKKPVLLSPEWEIRMLGRKSAAPVEPQEPR